MRRTASTVILAVASGLGVWVITNLDKTGAGDLFIVFVLIVVGSFLRPTPS